MSDRIGLHLSHGRGQVVRIQKVALDQIPPTHQIAPAPGQIIKRDHPPAARRKGLAAMAAHIAGAPGYQQRFRHLISPLVSGTEKQIRAARAMERTHNRPASASTLAVSGDAA